MSLKTKLAAIAAAFLFAQPVLALVVIQPIGITANSMGTSSGNVLRLIDQTGLTVGLNSVYTSGLTDFSDYLSGSPRHVTPNSSNAWRSQQTLTTGAIDFDLGGSFALENIVLWNGQNGFGVRSFTLFIDDDASFSSAIEVGTFDAIEVPNQTVLYQDFGFAETTGSHVRLRVNSTQATSSSFLILSEVAFGGIASQVVAEPASLALLAIGLMGVGFGKRRMRLPS